MLPLDMDAENHRSLTSQTVDGFKWNILSMAIMMVIQLGSSAIMARLIAPEVFGLLTMANLILRFGAYFSRMGIGSAVIQKKVLTKEDIRAAFTASVAFGLVVTLIIIVIAPLGKWIFNNESVVPVIRVMALTLFFMSISSMINSLMRREFRFREIAFAEIVSFILGAGGVGITMAYFGFGVWSLVFSSISQGMFLVLIYFLFSKEYLKFSFDFTKFKPILTFGSKVSIISFLEFICYNLDSIVLGRLIGAETLGHYHQASNLVNLPAQKISTSLTNVLFPSLSRVQENKEKLRKAYLSTISVLGTFLFIYSFSVAAASEEIILVVYGNRWAPAIPFLRVLSFAVPFSLLKSINGILLEAIAKLKFKIIATTSFLATLIVLFIVFYKLFGVIGFAWALFACELIYYVGYTVYIIKRLDFKLSDVVRMNFSILITGFITFLVIYYSRKALSLWNASNLVILLADLFLSLLILMFFYYIAPSRDLKISISNLLISNKSKNPILIGFSETFRKRFNDK